MKTNNTTVNVAIYSRKSRFTGKGESIANQIEECKKYCLYMLHEKEENISFTIYEDEGYSGKNLERPAMKRLLGELDGYDFFVCYRLDRVSRSVSDFSSFIKKLEAAQVEFISVSESFDTTKPMGRAMMYIASVFSQLERETIAERIRDNMHELAKTGRSFTRFFISFHATTHLRQNGFFGAERVVPFFYFRGCHVRVVV